MMGIIFMQAQRHRMTAGISEETADFHTGEHFQTLSSGLDESAESLEAIHISVCPQFIPEKHMTVLKRERQRR